METTATTLVTFAHVLNTQTLFDILWTAGAVFGIWVQFRAIWISRALVSAAKEGPTSPRTQTRLRNDLLLYRVRLAIVCNNTILGVLSVLQLVALLPPLDGLFTLYAALTVVSNEWTLNLLTWRDQAMIKRNGSSAFWRWLKRAWS